MTDFRQFPPHRDKTGKIAALCGERDVFAMETQYYYRTSGLCDVALPDRYLAVNCAGVMSLNRPFRTWMPQGRHDYYLQYCTNGEMSVCVGGKTLALRAGQLGIWSPDTPYEVRDAEGTAEYYWIHFTGFGAEGVLERCGLACNEPIGIAASEHLLRLFRDLFREFLLRGKCFDDACAGVLLNILTEFSRLKESRSLRNDSAARQIMVSLVYFHNHLSQPLTVADLAEKEHFSPSRYRAMFRRSLGISPSEYMTRVRICHACELLTTGDLSVREVAEACGYTDPLYFSRVFRARVGTSPSKYHESDLSAPVFPDDGAERSVSDGEE